MTIEKNRGNLLSAATALGLSIGISAANSVSAAAFDNFLKIDSVQGASANMSPAKWVEGKVVNGKLILKDTQGKTTHANQGTYHLHDRSVVVVINGNVISIKKSSNRASQAPMNTMPKATSTKAPLKNLK